MPATLKLDRIEDAQLVRDGTGIARAVRKAIVYGIDAFGTDGDPLVLVRALAVAGLPQIGDPFPVDATCLLQRHEVKGMAGNQASVLCVYEKPSGNGAPLIGRWIKSSDTITRTQAIQRNPVRLTPIRVKLTKDGTIGGAVTIEKTGTVHAEIPMARLVYRGNFYGINEGARWRLAIGSVNDAPWQGLPIGYWLFDEMHDEPIILNRANPDESLYAYTLIFTTRIYYDWAEYSFMRGPDGNFVTILEGAMDVIRTKQYDGNDTPYPFGVTRVESPPLANFDSLLAV